MEIAGRTPLHVAQAILNELLQGGPELEVGLSAKGDRVTVETVSGPANGTPLTLGPDSVIVASGGARGVTAQSLIHLAKQTHSRFVLLGRTPLTSEPAFCLGVSGESRPAPGVRRGCQIPRRIARPRGCCGEGRSGHRVARS